MDGKALWNKIKSILSSLGDELQTTTGLWFRASSDKGKLIVDKASIHIPSSKLSSRRPIRKNDFGWLCISINALNASGCVIKR